MRPVVVWPFRNAQPCWTRLLRLVVALGHCAYHAKKKEEGLPTMILAPMVGKKRKKGEEQNESDAAPADATNAENQSNVQLVGFRAVYV
jgi:hypothetical protein